MSTKTTPVVKHRVNRDVVGQQQKEYLRRNYYIKTYEIPGDIINELTLDQMKAAGQFIKAFKAMRLNNISEPLIKKLILETLLS